MRGYHTRVDRRGAHFLVQTQDKGASAQYVETLVYFSGRLLASRKSPYTMFLNSLNLSRKIEKIMEDQHQSVLKDIADGKFDKVFEE